MPAFLRFLPFVLLTFAASPALAALSDIPSEVSGYRASLTYAFLAPSSQFKFETGTVDLFGKRAESPYFERWQTQLRFAWAAAPGATETILLIPGLGSRADARPTLYVMEQLARSGKNVVAMPNPMSWQFALAASRSGMPGNFDEDLLDLDTAVSQVLHQLRRDGLTFGKIHLVGLSLGAYYAAALCDRALAEPENFLLSEYEIGNLVLVGPPADLKLAEDKLDALLRRVQGIPSDIALRYWSFGARFLEESPPVFELIEQNVKKIFNLPANKALDQYLISYNYQDTLSSLAYAASILGDVPMKSAISPGRRSARHAEVARFTLADYMAKFHPESSQNPFYVQRFTNLRFLNDSECGGRLHLAASEDDFLGDEGSLRALGLPGQVEIQARGGHLGNLWSPWFRDFAAKAWDK